MKAKLIKIIEDKGTVRQKLWLLTPSLQGHKYVVTSEAKLKYAIETYIFASNKNGEIQDYKILPGSKKGINDCMAVLEGLGYEQCT